MAFIPVPNTAHVQLVGRVDNQETVNDLYFFKDGGMSSAELANLVTNLFDWWNLSVATLLSEDWSTVQARGRDLTTINGVTAEAATSAGPGGVSGEAAPNNVAPAVSFRTGIAGRAFRGRNYLPGIPNSLITLNTLDAGFMGDIVTAYNLLLVGGTVLPTGFIWVVVSRFSGTDVDGKPIPRLEGIQTTITNVLFTDNVVDSQRRRLPGRGK